MVVKNEIFRALSINGNWGLFIVGPKGSMLPSEGSIEYIGKIGKFEIYQFIPGPTRTWVHVIKKEIVDHAGVTIVERMWLQNNYYVTLFLSGEYGLIEEKIYNKKTYKKESNFYVTNKDKIMMIEKSKEINFIKFLKDQPKGDTNGSNEA